MSNAKWVRVVVLSLGLSACATGGDVRAANGMVPYESEGDEADAPPVAPGAEASSPVRLARQPVALAQNNCVQLEPRYGR